MAKKTAEIKVHVPKLVSIALLSPHPRNANSQSAHTFGELVESIKESGFDESIIAVPRDDGHGYYVVSGNHRYEAAKQLGMDAIPTVIREDWTEVQGQIQLIKRNNLKGKLDSERFTDLVNHLSKDLDVPMDVLLEQMSFEDEDDFAKFYKEESKKGDSLMDKVMNTKEVSIVDHVSTILSELFEKHGSTVPSGFIVFPAGGKRHIYIAANASLKIALDQIVIKCIQQNVDVNVALGGLLALGMQHSDFAQKGINAELKKMGSATGPDEIDFVTL